MNKNNSISQFQPRNLITTKNDLGKFLKKYQEAKKRTITFPNVRKVMPQLISQQIISVQPMTLPTGLLFFVDYVYGSKTSSSLEVAEMQGNNSNKEVKDIDFLDPENKIFEY